MVYPALLPLMRTPRLSVVDRTDAPADFNGLVRFAGRRNVVSARVPSHFNRPLHLYFSFSLEARWGWVVNGTPRPIYPLEKAYMDVLLQIWNFCSQTFKGGECGAISAVDCVSFHAETLKTFSLDVFPFTATSSSYGSRNEPKLNFFHHSYGMFL
jgi:hypothetical protein